MKHNNEKFNQGRRGISKVLTIYYDTRRDGDMDKAIDELMKIEHSPYFQRRSRSEVARLVLGPALAKKVKESKRIYGKGRREQG